MLERTLKAVFLTLLTIFTVASNGSAQVLPESSDPWPMKDGRVWCYLDTEGREFSVKSSTAGRKNIIIDGKKTNVPAFVVETSFDGRIVRREVYVKNGIDTYKLKQTQVVEGVTTEFTPPIRISGAEQTAGCAWTTDGIATVTSSRIAKPAEFSYTSSCKITLHGSIKFADEIMYTFTVITDTEFHDDNAVDETESAYSGRETIQFIVGVGPKRIGQGEGFDKNALILQDVKGL
jgi:hypothetical protein